MSQEIKYEAVFGDQSLFDNAIGDSVAAINHGDVVLCFNSYNAFLIEVMKCNDLPLSDVPEFAMRRIIRTPIWTVEDQKAGRLPEVGAKLIYTETWDAFEFVGVIAGSMRWACKDFQDGFLYFFEQSEMSPIETPEEKARRERREWGEKASAVFINSSSNQFTSIYDALLSGELPMPKKE